jgi:hypothetical protein
MDAKRIIDEALRLPVDIRAALAGELLASLDDSELEPDRETAWSARSGTASMLTSAAT